MKKTQSGAFSNHSCGGVAKLRQSAVSLGVLVGYGILRLLPLDIASASFGWLARTLRPLLPRTRRAEANLARVLPHLTELEIGAITREMWDNIGRVLAEFPHLGELRHGPRVELIGADQLLDPAAAGRSLILFSAHFGNWELATLAFPPTDKPIGIVYRQQNNPVADRLLRHCRRHTTDRLVPKGAAGARAAMKILKAGGHLGLVVDQKMNDGIEVPFLGQPAMTAPALAQLALRYRCVVAPVRVDRLDGAHFRVTVGEPFEPQPSGDRDADIHAIMRRVNDTLGDWIRERPGQWMWLHRRWPPVAESTREPASAPRPTTDRPASETN